MKKEYCIKSWQKELDRQHITRCDTMNKKYFTFEHLFNGTFQGRINKDFETN